MHEQDGMQKVRRVASIARHGTPSAAPPLPDGRRSMDPRQCIIKTCFSMVGVDHIFLSTMAPCFAYPEDSGGVTADAAGSGCAPACAAVAAVGPAAPPGITVTEAGADTAGARGGRAAILAGCWICCCCCHCCCCCCCCHCGCCCCCCHCCCCCCNCGWPGAACWPIIIACDMG